jgi:hypothetical protein
MIDNHAIDTPPKGAALSRKNRIVIEIREIHDGVGFPSCVNGRSLRTFANRQER